MGIIKTFFVGMAVASAGLAQTINISGVVKDSISNAPVKNVVVRLVQNGFADTTDAAGLFSVQGISGGVIKKDLANSRYISPVVSSEGAILFTLGQRERVEIKGFSMLGKVVYAMQKDFLPGTIALSPGKNAAGIYLFQIRIHGQTYNLKNRGLNTGGVAQNAAIPSSNSASLNKRAISQAAFADTLAFTLRGCYGGKKMAVADPVTNNLTVLYACAPGPANVNGIPAAAAAIGYNRLVFSDDFTSLSTIDVNTTGAAGYNWYTDIPFGGAVVDKSNYSVDTSVLTIDFGGTTQGWGLDTYSIEGNTGHAFKFGYFEARMHFNPLLADSAAWFPCWWSLSLDHCQGLNNSHYAELDFFEAYTGGYSPYNYSFVGTLHDFNPDNHQNSNNGWRAPFYAGLDYNQWHIYGCLWQPGSVSWYLDNVLLSTVTYSADGYPNPPAGPSSPIGCFSIADSQSNLLILGSAEGWPLYVDWVHVYQQ
ncbi:MAG: family 16 glycosylhydrolase [Chitinivibrionales bacterium]|nr:family 16 glycosylhydrolase [Chitinivibrionales bacterium]